MKQNLDQGVCKKSDQPQSLYKADSVPDYHNVVYSYQDTYGFYYVFCESPASL